MLCLNAEEKEKAGLYNTKGTGIYDFLTQAIYA